jgi:hypothetical protein
MIFLAEGFNSKKGEILKIKRMIVLPLVAFMLVGCSTKHFTPASTVGMVGGAALGGMMGGMVGGLVKQDTGAAIGLIIGGVYGGVVGFGGGKLIDKIFE